MKVLMPITLHVCVTCRAGQPVLEGEQCAGEKLHAALLREPLPEKVEIVPVECLSACSRGATVALSAPGCWSYVYGDLTEADASDVLAGAEKYASTSDGIVPWRERPEIFRKQSVARIPPLRDASKEAAE